MANRIEEVKKAIARAKAIAITVKRPLEDVLAEEICQLFPQPLDDKELEKAIQDILDTAITVDNQGNEITKKAQILALLQQKMEEARRQEREGIIILGNESCPHAKIFTTKIGVPYSTKYKRECSECWQALKE